jgi:hypothetical protein
MNLQPEKSVKYDTVQGVSKERIIKDYEILKQFQPMQQVLQALPYFALILNEYRQIIVSNQKFLKDYVKSQVKYLFGRRPGEIFQCEHVDREGAECGTSESCAYCGVFNAIKESRARNKPVTRDCRITSRKSGTLVAYDFNVKCVPLKIDGQVFYFLTLIDISHEKRKNAIERIFFHDVINLVGNLKGIVNVLTDDDYLEERGEYMEILSSIAEQLAEEIISQRDLSAAESKNLVVNVQEVNSLELVNSIIENTMFIENKKRCKISVGYDSTDFSFRTDPVLLKRIMVNMMKNALEASQPDSNVIIGCNKKNDKAHFYVHNDNYIPADIRKQIFQRSFSTKEINRGLGTYSMRLIGENYLKGKVYFTSDKLKGTTFSIDLP